MFLKVNFLPGITWGEWKEWTRDLKLLTPWMWRETNLTALQKHAIIVWMWHEHLVSYCFRTWCRWHGKHGKQEKDFEPNGYHWLHKKNGQKCPCGEPRHYFEDWVGIWEVVDVYTTCLKAAKLNSCIPVISSTPTWHDKEHINHISHT